jgi:tetratricopeptide (TPR) repeat protein
MPPGVVITLNKAANLVDSDNTQEAIEVLRRFQNKQQNVDPVSARKRGYTHYYIDFTLGNYYLMLSKPEKALVHFQTAASKNKNYSDSWINLAKCYYDLNQPGHAADAFHSGYQTQEQEQKNAKYLYYSVVCYTSADNFQKAEKVFRQILNNHSAEVTLEWKETFVHVLRSLKKDIEALPYIEELAKKTIGNKQKGWREMLLYQYMSLKMDTKALAYARLLTRVDTVETKWWKALAHLYFQKDQYEKGLVALLVYSFINPLTPQEMMLLADIHLMLGIPDQSIAFYEKLLEDSLDANIIKKLVNGCIRLYHYEKALSWLDQGLSLKIDSKMKYDLLKLKGSLLFESEKYQEAAKVFQQVYQMEKKNGQPLLMLGYALLNSGQLDKAQSAFTKAKKYKKQYKEARKALRHLKSIR